MKSKTVPTMETNTPASVVTRTDANAKISPSSVERVFGILEDLAIGGSMTFTDVAEMAKSRRDEIPKATLSNLMSMLTRVGYLRYRQDDRTYSLGIRLISLGEMAKAALQEAGPQKECRELLKGVVQKVRVGTHFAILDSGYAVYIMREEAPDFFGAKIWEGRQQVPYLTAVGKALMCCLGREQVKEILEQHSGAANTKQGQETRLETLMEELAKIRKRGWAIDDEEHAAGVRCVAAPIYSGADEVVASIGVSRRAKEFDLAEMDRYGRTYLRPAADQAAKTPRILSVLARHYSMSNNPKRGRL
jgi:IclR family acetate operon transcriptional repressor